MRLFSADKVLDIVKSISGAVYAPVETTGGMITENRREVEDKIPILGDIPLIGRLFRSTYEETSGTTWRMTPTSRISKVDGSTAG